MSKYNVAISRFDSFILEKAPSTFMVTSPLCPKKRLSHSRVDLFLQHYPFSLKSLTSNSFLGDLLISPPLLMSITKILSIMIFLYVTFLKTGPYSAFSLDSVWEIVTRFFEMFNMASTYSANFQSSVDRKSVTVNPGSFLPVIKYKSSNFLTFNVDLTSWWKLLIRVPRRSCLIMVVGKFWSWLADPIISKNHDGFCEQPKNALPAHSVSSLKLALLEMSSQHLLFHIFEPFYL